MPARAPHRTAPLKTGATYRCHHQRTHFPVRVFRGQTNPGITAGQTLHGSGNRATPHRVLTHCWAYFRPHPCAVVALSLWRLGQARVESAGRICNPLMPRLGRARRGEPQTGTWCPVPGGVVQLVLQWCHFRADGRAQQARRACCHLPRHCRWIARCARVGARRRQRVVAVSCVVGTR